MIREIKYCNLDVLRYSVTKVRVNGKEINGSKYMRTRVLEEELCVVWEKL